MRNQFFFLYLFAVFFVNLVRGKLTVLPTIPAVCGHSTDVIIDGVYNKSICISPPPGQIVDGGYEGLEATCLSRGMRAFRYDSSEALQAANRLFIDVELNFASIYIKGIEKPCSLLEYSPTSRTVTIQETFDCGHPLLLFCEYLIKSSFRFDHKIVSTNTSIANPTKRSTVSTRKATTETKTSSPPTSPKFNPIWRLYTNMLDLTLNGFIVGDAYLGGATFEGETGPATIDKIGQCWYTDHGKAYRVSKCYYLVNTPNAFSYVRSKNGEIVKNAVTFGTFQIGVVDFEGTLCIGKVSMFYDALLFLYKKRELRAINYHVLAKADDIF